MPVFAVAAAGFRAAKAFSFVVVQHVTQHVAHSVGSDALERRSFERANDSRMALAVHRIARNVAHGAEAVAFPGKNRI